MEEEDVVDGHQTSINIDDLSTAFGTETLAERAESFANTPSSRTDMPVEVIGAQIMEYGEIVLLHEADEKVDEDFRLGV